MKKLIIIYYCYDPETVSLLLGRNIASQKRYLVKHIPVHTFMTLSDFHLEEKQCMDLILQIREESFTPNLK